MAILKAINRGPRNSHESLRNSIDYVLRDEKNPLQYRYVDGPFNYPEITPENVFESFLEEKRLWGKDSGKMCSHYVVSFHKDEKITPEDVFEFGKELYGNIFDGYQFIMAVHQDRDHIHAHAIVNSVSYLNGKKLHITDSDLANYKKLCNKLCLEKGYTVAKKGYHFDGQKMKSGNITAWDKSTYSILKYHPQRSYKAACVAAIKKALHTSTDINQFISEMNSRGWKVYWNPKRKYITFENSTGFKIRNSTLGKTMNMDLSKEAIEYELGRNRNHYREQSINTGSVGSAYTYGQNHAGKPVPQAGTGEVIGTICAGFTGAAIFLTADDGNSGENESENRDYSQGITESKRHIGDKDEEHSPRLHM